MADKKVHICPECRKQFEGWPNSIYCPECATARYKERQKRYSQRHRAKEAEKKKVARELAEKKPAEKINTKQCEGCWYWRMAGSYQGYKCCHYILDIGKPRKRRGSKCYSRVTTPQRRQVPAEW